MNLLRIIKGSIIPFACYLIFYTQGAIFPISKTLSIIVTSILVGYALYGAYKIHQHKNPLFIYLLDIFLTMYFFYYLKSEGPHSLQHEDLFYYQIRLVIITIMPFYIFYHFSSIGKISKNDMIWMTIMYLAAMVPLFYYQEAIMLKQQWAIDIKKEQYEITNNISYDFLHALIFLPLIRNRKILFYSVLFFIMFFILMGAKRGAFIIFIIGCLILFYKEFKESKWAYFWIPTAVGSIIYSIYLAYSTNLYLQERFIDTLEGNYSNRDFIFEHIINYCIVNPQSFYHLLFGYGYNASLWISGELAHNDWLELLSGFGIMGIIVYALFFNSIWKEYKNMPPNEIKIATLIGIVILFTKTFFSMGFTSSTIIFIYLGFLLGYNRHEKKNLIYN